MTENKAYGYNIYILNTERTIADFMKFEFNQEATFLVPIALIHHTRIEMGLTQEQLAEKVGTTKSYISKIENNIKEARISTLQKIIELGFGGRLELNIKIQVRLERRKKNHI